jgi:hypothetical protein
MTRLNLMFNAAAGLLLREAQVVEGLQVQPKFRRCIEVARKAEGGIGGDAALAAHDLVEARRFRRLAARDRSKSFSGGKTKAR